MIKKHKNLNMKWNEFRNEIVKFKYKVMDHTVYLIFILITASNSDTASAHNFHKVSFVLDVVFSFSSWQKL